MRTRNGQKPAHTQVIYRPGIGFNKFPQGRPVRAIPLWWALLPLGLLLLALPLLALMRPPSSLQNAVLAGARGPGCLRLVLASDHSGSMHELQGARDQAMGQLFNWAPGNLRPNDEIAVVTFADNAEVALPPTRVDHLVSLSAADPDPTGTLLDPVLGQVSGFSGTRCRTALVVMGDGLFFDLPGDEASGTSALFDAGVDEVALLVPGRTMQDRGWSRAFPSAPAKVFDGHSPDATGMVIAEQLAEWTGQELSRNHLTKTNHK